MAQPCSAKAIANYFLDLAKRDGTVLDPMQIQKLVYIAHGFHLALLGKPLIRESVEAWTYGPVIASLYHEFKRFGRGPIREQAVEYKSRRLWGHHFHEPSIEDCTEDSSVTRAFLSEVWDVYGGFTAIQLANMTHELGAPWDTTRKKYPGKESVSIPDDEIKTYYLEKIKKSKKSAKKS